MNNHPFRDRGQGRAAWSLSKLVALVAVWTQETAYARYCTEHNKGAILLLSQECIISCSLTGTIETTSLQSAVAFG